MKHTRKPTIHSRLRGISSLLVVLAVLFGAGTGASAAANYYVNGANEVYSGTLSGAYAVGGGGTAQIGTGSVYAVTADGTVLLEEGGAATGTLQEFDYNIPHLSASTTVNVKQTVMRVGLYYYYSSSRDSSLASANLQNVSGSGKGYEFGYFNDNRQFCSFGFSTQNDAISMLIDRNMYYNATANAYYEGSTGSTVVGCYHVRLGQSYSDYAQAEAARLALGYSDSFIKYLSGQFYIMVGNYTSADAAYARQTAVGGTVDSGTSHTITVVLTGSNTILFEYDGGGSSYLGVMPSNASGKALTWFKGYQYYGGFCYKRMTGNKMTVVNYVDVEDYLIGVVSNEMSESWPLEALKAQAVCARTYAARRLNSYNSYGFDVTADTYCQAYHGVGSAGNNVRAAVSGTKGVYLTYQGELCDAVYSASDGGGSESNVNVNGKDFGYLQGKIDPFEAAVEEKISNYRYTVILTGSQLASKLSGYGVSTIVNVEPTYSDTGNTIALKFTDVNGKSVTIKQGGCRTTMGMRSQHYTVTYDSGKGAWVFEGAGWGHNVGMSQWGAYSMAKEYGYTYDQILNFYYTGITLSIGVAQ